MRDVSSSRYRASSCGHASCNEQSDTKCMHPKDAVPLPPSAEAAVHAAAAYTGLHTPGGMQGAESKRAATTLVLHVRSCTLLHRVMSTGRNECCLGQCRAVHLCRLAADLYCLQQQSRGRRQTCAAVCNLRQLRQQGLCHCGSSTLRREQICRMAQCSAPPG